MRSEPSSEATPDTGVMGCWRKSDQMNGDHPQQTEIDRHNINNVVQDTTMTDSECKKNEENFNLDLRSRSTRRRPAAPVTPDLELTDSSSVSVLNFFYFNLFQRENDCFFSEVSDNSFVIFLLFSNSNVCFATLLKTCL